MYLHTFALEPYYDYLNMQSAGGPDTILFNNVFHVFYGCWMRIIPITRLACFLESENANQMPFLKSEVKLNVDHVVVVFCQRTVVHPCILGIDLNVLVDHVVGTNLIKSLAAVPRA